MHDRPLAWRIEQTCLNAWPALRQVRWGDWLLRFAAGVSRRANSANPLRADVRDIDAAVARFEPLFRGQGLPVLFRIPSIIGPEADRRLAQLGYRAEGESLTLYADLKEAAGRRDPEVELRPRPSAAWLAAMAAMQGHTAEQRAAYARIVESIALPTAFAALRSDGEMAALAYGALHDGLLCCESVITAPPHRGRRHARRLLATLIDWAARNGAGGVCLQVEAVNAPALALYRRLGMRSEAYRYHYRRAPPAT